MWDYTLGQRSGLYVLRLNGDDVGMVSLLPDVDRPGHLVRKLVDAWNTSDDDLVIDPDTLRLVKP